MWALFFTPALPAHFMHKDTRLWEIKSLNDTGMLFSHYLLTPKPKLFPHVNKLSLLFCCLVASVMSDSFATHVL